MTRLALVLAALALQETQAERKTHWIVETTVKGALTASFSGQSYPFAYEGWTTLSADEAAALAKDGDLAEALARRLARAFAEPKPVEKKKDDPKAPKKDPKIEDPATDDEISGVSFTVKEGKIKGKLTVLHKEGAGTRKIAAEVSGTVGKDGLAIKLDSAKASGTWDWGGGVADLDGKVEKHEAVSRAPKE